MGAAKTGFCSSDYVKITVLGFALTALWQSLHSIILPLRLLDFVPEAQKNTYLGLLTLSGLLLAMFAQPLSGAASDNLRSRWGRRRPFILAGGIVIICLLPGIGAAANYATLFGLYCLLQIASNTAQGPYQAFIPEFVPPDRRGQASGVKGLMEIAGGLLFVYVSSILMSRYVLNGDVPSLWLALAILMAVIAAAVTATICLVREAPPPPARAGISPLSTLARIFGRDIWQNRGFLWFLASRLLVFMAFTMLQQFALYFFRDVIGVPDPAQATFRFSVAAVAGMLLVVWPAGYLSDRIGRRPLSALAGLLGAAGIAIIIVIRQYDGILWAAGIIGIAMGTFNSANWALAMDFVPKAEEARYLGITNMATAGGAVLARLIGPGIDFFNRRAPLSGYNFMLFVCLAYFIIGAALVLKIGKRSS